MARQDRTRKSTTDKPSAREIASATGDPERRTEQDRDWADEAAMARTADDPRAMAPRDRAGRPSTGDTR
ncbi:hypothetical protein [Micromonospora echinofusca]|uniref:Uncharacterized protein n=1 Tax=Micromonospora echinofusca TaxID=47858 RepID=A0ABS3VW68_MICEH|nr:hypothetical protein [Micromonospora echinofusca]MBO4208791.1 hypothetical protein [Micromonospora echinofusca]